MRYLADIKMHFNNVLEEFQSSFAIKHLSEGSLEPTHYKWMLRQIFHHARENPQIQALATVYFKGHQRALVKSFYKHATAEIGHDQLALNDLAVLGEDVNGIPYENPLPATTALLSFAFYQIRNLNPVGYLGYLFFLEFTPTVTGRAYQQALAAAGVPLEAMTFLRDHTTIDVAHNRLMEQIYIDGLITSKSEFDAVIYAMKTTGVLYANMLEAAVRQADKPVDWGINHCEFAPTAEDARRRTA